jgi:hypothetical protein
MAAVCKTGALMHAILEYTFVAIWGEGLFFNGRPRDWPVPGGARRVRMTAVACGRPFDLRHDSWLDPFAGRADNDGVSSSVDWCRLMASRDPRTQELNNLKVALATFALQLDIFEARIRNGPPKALIRPDRSRPPDLNFAVKTGPAMKSRPRD